jgi:hypothetical protein
MRTIYRGDNVYRVGTDLKGSASTYIHIVLTDHRGTSHTTYERLPHDVNYEILLLFPLVLCYLISAGSSMFPDDLCGRPSSTPCRNKWKVSLRTCWSFMARFAVLVRILFNGAKSKAGHNRMNLIGGLEPVTFRLVPCAPRNVLARVFSVLAQIPECKNTGAVRVLS